MTSTLMFCEVLVTSTLHHFQCWLAPPYLILLLSDGMSLLLLGCNNCFIILNTLFRLCFQILYALISLFKHLTLCVEQLPESGLLGACFSIRRSWAVLGCLGHGPLPNFFFWRIHDWMALSGWPHLLRKNC